MPDDKHPPRFEEEAAAPRNTLVGELWLFLAHNKKWWLLPILVVFLGVGLLMVLAGTAAAPFIYTLF